MRAKSVKEIIIEGVADKYGEKFGIPNYPEIEDRKALTASIKDKDIVLIPPKNYSTLYKIIKNPSSPNSINKDEKGVIDKNGNFYCNAGIIAAHDLLLNILDDLNILEYDKKWNVKLPTDYLTVQRHKNTNIIAIGESNLFAYPSNTQYYKNAQKFKYFTEEERDKSINYFLQKAKEKNSSFNFVNKVIREYEN